MDANLDYTAVPKLYFGKDFRSPLHDDSIVLDGFELRNRRDIWCSLEAEAWSPPVEQDLGIEFSTGNGDDNGSVVYKPRELFSLGLRVLSSWADPSELRGSCTAGPSSTSTAKSLANSSLKRAYDLTIIPEPVTVSELILMQQVDQRASELDRVVEPGRRREILRPRFQGLKARGG
jgi:hypothetical protein